ncbi:MAG: hypothetical protein EPN22_13495 [Nitrospirae bacterium]|nr:MAG: hypothetical protein EPN22_13495 [Nitrospirota bacterium]
MKPLISRLKPYYNSKEFIAAVLPTIGNIESFEMEFAEKFECKSGIMFPYGRSGLYSLFKIWQLSNDEIICPAYTCVVVAHAIVLSGNIPVFVDCEEGSFNMSYAGIRNVITEKTRAIVVTHLFGYPMDVGMINKIVEEAEEKYGNKIYIIQDVAHAFGAKWNGEMVTKYGDASIFGLNISKIINSIFGGMVITNDDVIYKKLIEYRNNNFPKQNVSRSLKRFIYLVSVYIAFNKFIYTLVNWLENKGFLDRFVKYYDESVIDFPCDWNYYPVEIEARVGLVQLRKYDEIIQKRTSKSIKYAEYFKNDDRIKLVPLSEGATCSHFVGLVSDRDKWIAEYRERGIQLGTIIDYSVPYMSAYEKYRRGEYPVSRFYSEHIINFPNWPE